MEYKDKTRQESLALDVRHIGEDEPAHAFTDEVRQLSKWLDEIQEANAFLYLKRLSANDTGATGSHQVGIYVPDSVTGAAIPSIARTDCLNPEETFLASIDSHGGISGEVRAIFYNNKHFGGTRNEARLTRWAWKGVDSPMKDPDSTGALVVVAFVSGENGITEKLKLWVCRSPGEEEFLAREFGEILPGEALVGYVSRLRGGVVFEREVDPDADIPGDWSAKFPSGQDILDYVFSLSTFATLDPDDRLIKRRQLEYDVFRKVELVHVMPLIKKGFSSVEDFISIANSVANRRKSRSGKSLELHLRKIFDEEGMPTVGEQCVTENNKKPDFLFPDCTAYHDESRPSEKLRMLGVKTTCKDRWRQVLSEAEKIKMKHLFTLQEGVSMNQYAEMSGAGIRLVVPKSIHKKYPSGIRGEILTLSDFVSETLKVVY